MAQAEGVIPFWEKVLFENDFKRFVEFGTYKGALSTFFLLWCMQRKAKFYTYDAKTFKFSRLAYGLKLPKYFQQLDVFDYEESIGRLIQQVGRTIVYCDGGNKAREINVFSKYLKSGDLIAVHDMATEIFYYEIPLGLERIYQHNAVPITAVFRKL